MLLATAQCTKLPYEPVQILVLDVETQGDEIDGDGYVATIDDEMSRPVAANGSATFEGLGAGERLLTISGLAGNCAVDGPNPRPLSIEEDAVTRASVTVSCSPVAGLLIVEAVTTGTELDPDGYTVSVDGSATRTIGTNGSVTFEGLTPGEHVVSLENIADNCSLLDEETNPRVVTLSADASTNTAFQVQCGPRGGDLVVVAATTGTDVDPDGYSISLNDSTSAAIETNGAITFTNLADGDYQVTIDGLANNCTVTEGSRSRMVTVTSNASAAETFFVFCGPPAGALVVDVTTTGTDVDDGYLVSVGEGVTKPLTTNGSATFEGLAAGEYEVELSGVAGNCAVVIDETPNPRTIVLTAGASSATSFFVHCQPVAGALVVDVSTRGATEPEGYSISVDGVASKGVAPNGAVLFEALLAGDRAVRLGLSDDDCLVDGANPRTVSIDPGASTRASLAVFCGSSAGSAIRVEVSTTGPHPDPDGYEISLDGAAGVPVATNGTVSFTELATGRRSVRIGGLSENCSLGNGTRVREVVVGSEEPTVVVFAVVCRGDDEDDAGTGTLMVKPRTTGVHIDPDGYIIYLDESDSVVVAPNRTALFEDVPAGLRVVRIDGIASNCTLRGRPTRRVRVTAGELRVFRFFLECEARS